MPQVVILGAGGNARETLGILDDMNRAGARAGADEWDVLGYVDDDPSKHGLMLDDKPVLGDFSWFAARGGTPPLVICAVGSSPGRRRLVLKALELGLDFCSAISPRAEISPLARVGKGATIFPGTVVGPQVTVGNHVIVNVGCTISHEARLGDYCTLAPGVHVAGCTVVGDGGDLGIGTVTIQGVTVGSWSIVGAGCVLIEDVPPNVTVVGVPARIIRTREESWHERL
jgi:sugar O-acyltransferase (sialic acid O-acetyltransferase NeuD family)